MQTGKNIAQQYEGIFLILWGTKPFFVMPKLNHILFFIFLSKQNTCTGNSY